MNNLAKIGGVSALINATAYIVGIGMALTVLSPFIDADTAMPIPISMWISWLTTRR
ncbi:hypothetical protein [Cohnella cellulosilytica]|uniref:hypothetical protein n=1 Tax=Cohnella cellulosilytica TaxID=986710 RepID=UPI00366CA7B0